MVYGDSRIGLGAVPVTLAPWGGVNVSFKSLSTPHPPRKRLESSGMGFNVTSGNQYGLTGERFLGTDEQGASLKNYFFFIIRKAQ